MNIKKRTAQAGSISMYVPGAGKTDAKSGADSRRQEKADNPAAGGRAGMRRDHNRRSLCGDGQLHEQSAAGQQRCSPGRGREPADRNTECQQSGHDRKEGHEGDRHGLPGGTAAGSSFRENRTGQEFCSESEKERAELMPVLKML